MISGGDFLVIIFSEYHAAAGTVDNTVGDHAETILVCDVCSGEGGRGVSSGDISGGRQGTAGHCRPGGRRSTTPSRPRRPPSPGRHWRCKPPEFRHSLP